ncbi:hypothetical protein pEaSNUABM3_00313 [Erwinia phage pEa_SNUABM_3]|uniref:Uncharacterized protein n=1 Tax=Erwinia phage pEa_SNUABM_3 TaxID=2869552 RepID=A0AAE7XJJ1_9CAUD|nr:hypothetical protein MPK68_gp313 [Erwinia phage pEa_SNUABM_3]QZE56510.1 hypothetical protein pEaSNUABM3_00313 [Erwinia phage pEa_SNUABM_3]
MKEKNILVLNRVRLVMEDMLVEQFADLAREDQERAGDLSVIMLSKIQQGVNAMLANGNPEACCRADVAWTECSFLSTTGLFVIASSADAEVLNHFEDSDYLCHIRAIEHFAKEAGFKFTVEPIRVAFPFESTIIPEALRYVPPTDNLTKR